MAHDIPRIAATLERAKLFSAGIVFLQALFIWQRNDWLGAACLLVGVIVALNVVRVLSTRVSAVGVSQFTWRGRVHLRWDEVISVTRKKRSIVITGTAGSIRVPTDSFYDTEAAVRYIDAHVPQRRRAP
jgi:hypothetical protein